MRKVEPTEARAVLEELGKETEAVIEQSSGKRTPGLTIGDRKTPYTHRDLCDIYGVVEFIPDETKPVTVSGVRYQCIANVSMAVPTVVRDVFYRSKREAREAALSLPRDSGFETMIGLGQGSLEPER